MGGRGSYSATAGGSVLYESVGSFSDEPSPVRPWRSGRTYARPNTYRLVSDRLGLRLKDSEGDRLERAFASAFAGFVRNGIIKKRGDYMWFPCETSDKHGSYDYLLEVRGRYDYTIVRRVHIPNEKKRAPRAATVDG